MRAQIRRAAALLLLSATGCTTPSHHLTALQAHEAMHLASRALGGSHDVKLILVPARTPEEDAAFLARSPDEGPAAIVEQVAGYFAAAAHGPQQYAVVGRHPAKTARVVRDALALNEGRTLTQLAVVYLGDTNEAPPLAALAASLGATFAAVPYPAPTQPGRGVSGAEADRDLESSR